VARQTPASHAICGEETCERRREIDARQASNKRNDIEYSEDEKAEAEKAMAAVTAAI